MHTDVLKLFREVAATGSISRGAEALRVTPSAASQSMNELERNLGVRLLDRSTRPLALTREGELYADFCRDVLQRFEDLKASFAAVEHSVRIAAIYSVGISEMTRLEEKLHLRYPGIQLHVDYLRPEKVYDAVRQDRADLGLVSYAEADREIAALAWRQERMVVVAAPGHWLASAASVLPSDLQGLEFIAFDADLPIARHITRYLEAHRVQVRESMHFDNLQTIKEAVSLGSAISILPARLLETEQASGRLVAIPLAGEELSRPLGIIFRKRKTLTKAARAFLDLLQEAPATTLPATVRA